MIEFRNLVKIRQSYHEKFDALFLWDTVLQEQYKIDSDQNRIAKNHDILPYWSALIQFHETND